MATVDVSKLSFKDLQKLKATVDQSIADKREQTLKALVDKYATEAAEAGFTPEEAMNALLPYLPASKRKKVGGQPVVKYRDAKTGDVWSGKGRTARWLQAHIDAGKKKDDFLVKQ
jgi:DNA-binding protein H-NS